MLKNSFLLKKVNKKKLGKRGLVERVLALALLGAFSRNHYSREQRKGNLIKHLDSTDKRVTPYGIFSHQNSLLSTSIFSAL